MPKFLVELEDGKKFQIEADQQPSPEEISQYLGGQTQPEKPFFDLSETASSLGRAVTSLPTTTMASLSQAWEGLENPWKRSEGYLSRRQEMQALQDELAASEAEAAASGDVSTVSSAIREATPSLGFSGATLLPSIAAGAGTLALSKSPAAARGAAAATSALMAYRMAGAQFLDDAKERIDAYFQENVGRAPNEQEQAEAYQELLPLARKFGAAEAGPEALGNLALGGAGKYIRRALGGKGGIVDLASNALGKVTGTKAALAGAGALASETGTEAVTKVEQDRIQKQFEEGIMRGESPESVALADRSLGDYTSAFKEVAPATIATVGMMGAAGLGPKAISRGIQALRPKPPVEQIVEEPFMPDPAEVAKTIGDASVEQLAATGNEASAAAQADFNAILDETLGKAPEPAIQPEQAAEEIEAEVTPSPAMEMPSPPQGVDMALAPVSPIITEAPLSEGAERNRAIIAEAAAKLRGEAPKTISAGVKAAIPQQPVETQEDAIQEQIPDEGVLRQERPEMELQGLGEGNAQPEEIAETSEKEVASREGVYSLETRTNFAKLPASVRGDRFILSPVTGTVFDRMYAQSVTPPAFTRPEQAVRSLNESRYNADVSLPVSLGRSADGVDIFTSAADLPPVVIPQQPPSPPTGTVPTKPLPAGRKVTPRDVATERDLTKPEQMTLRQFETSRQRPDKAPNTFFDVPLPRSQQAEFKSSQLGETYGSLAGVHRGLVSDAIEDRKPVLAEAADSYGWSMPSGYVKQGDLYVFQPSSASAGLGAGAATAPNGVIESPTAPKAGKPQTTKAAAKTQTPESVGRGLGGSRGVQSEPSEGSIPEVAKVSTETETPSTEKSPVTEAAIRDLEESISKLPEKAQSKWTSEVMAKARDFYDSDDRNQSRLDGLTQIQKNKVYDSLYRADKAAAAEQDRIEKAQKARDKEIEKEEREAAKKEAEMLKREEMRSKAIDSIIGKGEKKKRKFGQVTNSDAIAAVAMLVSSKDIPGVLTTWWGTKGDFLRDPANQTADPEIYARIKAGELVEGFFNKGRAYVFLDGIGVSDQDLLRGKEMGVSAQVAAVRRVLLHESLVHRGIHGLPLRHRRLVLNWVRQNSTPQELDELAQLYTEYANWRNSDYQFEALAEEFLAKKVDGLTEIPKDGPMAKLMDILRQIWDFIVGYKREPTLSDLKSVLKLLKSGAEALTNDTLKDGGGVKLSYAGEKAIENLPEERRQFMRDSLETAKAMAAAGKDSEEIRAVTGWFPGKYDGKMRWEVPDEGARLKSNLEDARTVGDALDHTELFSVYPQARGIKFELLKESDTFAGSFDPLENKIKLHPLHLNKLGTLIHEVQHWIQREEELPVGSSPKQFSSSVGEIGQENLYLLYRDFNRLARSDYDSEQEFLDDQKKLEKRIKNATKILKAKTTSNAARLTAGEIEARDVQARQKLTPEQRAATAPYSSENIAPEDAIVLFGSGPQASVQFSSDYTAAESAGNEAARSTLYSERDMDIREAIRRAYEAMPKTNSVAVPIGELFAKTEELMPGVTQDEFSNVLQDLFEDNGAVLQEGESDFFVTTPEGRRAGFVVVMPRAAKASRIKAEDDSVQKFKEDIAAIENGSIKANFGGVQFTNFPASQRTVKPKEFYSDAAIRLVNDLQKKKNSIEDIAFSIQSPDFLESVGIENNLSAQDALTIEVRNRVNNDLRREKRPERKKVLDKMNKRLSGYWQGTGSTSGKNLGIRKHLINDPRYRWMFIKDLADKSIMDAVENVARSNMDVQTLPDGRVAPQEFTDKANAAGEQATDQAAQAIADDIESSVEDNEDAALIREGEETLDKKTKSLWDRAKMLIMRLAMYARADKADIKTGSKASLSKEQRDELNAILRMPKAERDKARAKDEAELKAVLKALLGEESDAKTPEQKKTRGKRIKGIQTIEKRVKKGKPADVKIEGESESSEEQVSKAERTAQAILKDLSERYSDPLIIKEKKPNVDAMRELYKERVKQGVGPNQMKEESFVNKAVELGADEATAGILWKAAELEIDAREAMRQDKILQRKAAVGARADAQAHRIIFATERLKRQRGFTDIDTNPKKDTIIQAFRDQVKNPVNLEDFVARLKSLNVSETVAKRLFTAAEREKADLEAMKKFQAEKRALEEIEMAEKKASQIIYRFEEQYRQGFKNPPEGMTGQEQRDSIIRAFRDQVNNPTSFDAFAERLANLKVGKEVAERMFLTASRERADLIRVKDIKIAKRKVEIADKQASRLIYSTEERFRQGSKDLNESKDGDSINKAFRDQVSTPVSEADFSKRLAKLNVSPDVAARLFKTAAREKADLEAMEAFKLLEGPDALKRMLSEINKARPGEQAPLSKQIPWREILSQKAKTVEEYRQRIFDAISANEAFQNLTDEQKSKLADLFSQAWEQKRTEILDRMLTNLINQEEAAKRLTKDGADALRAQRMKLIEDINFGILDAEEVMKRLAEKFGIKTEFTEQERQKIDSLIETIQDETLNRVKRNKAAYELLKTLSGNLKVPIVKMLADYWVASVLSGMNTATSIALAVGNGAFELLSGVYRIMKTAVSDPKELPAEIAASFKAMAAFLKAFKREGRLAWQYLVTGDREFLDPSMNDVLNDLNYESIGRSTALAEKMAESDKILQKVMGIWMRSVSRLLTALDSFNAGVTKSGSLPIVLRQLDLTPEGIAKAEEAMNLQNYKDQIIRRDFGNKQPKTQREKAIIDSWAKDEMMAELDKYGRFSENANFYGQQGAMTLDPSGIGGVIYRLIKSTTGSLTTGSDKFLAESQRKWKQAEDGEKITQGLQLALAYFLQFGAYNAANLAGLRFARFAGNKFNQGLSFIPGIGALRIYEAELDKSRVEAKEAFTDMINRNQTAGFLLSIAGYMILKAIADEPDDEKRGWFINGGWSNLTPEKKQQKLAAGQKEFTIGIGDKIYNYQNWPISSALAAIGGLSDLIRFSPEQWNEKSAASRLTSAAASGVFAATEIPALSGFQTLFGNNLSSKDPNEKKLDRFANVMAGWAGGFSPRILKDFDYLADPSLRKYETLWEKTASHIPIYRRYIGEEYYDVLGKQIEKKIYPGSREFMEKESAPEYQILGKLNSRGIWLTPANAEYRMVGKGRNRRRLTQEEADAYSLETGKGYRQMLLRYGQRALQMPTERARAFLSDKADEVRDRSLKKVYRR